MSINLGKRVQKIFVTARREQIYNVTGGGQTTTSAVDVLLSGGQNIKGGGGTTTTFTDHFCPLGNVRNDDGGGGGSAVEDSSHGESGDVSSSNNQQRSRVQSVPAYNHHGGKLSTSMASNTYLNRINPPSSPHSGPMPALKRVSFLVI